MIPIRDAKFGFAAPTFAGYGDAHIDVPCLERINFDFIKDTALLAEKYGFDSVWLADHLVLGRSDEVLEVWTTLSALAAVTSKIKLGALVLNVLTHNPGLLAKMASTLDHVSKGRLYLGIGSGSLPQELDSYGFQYPTRVAERIDLLEEAIVVLKLLWTGQPVNHHGKFFSLNDAVCAPSCVQKPSIPILIGCLSDSQLIHRAAARHADMYNTIGSIEDVRRRLTILRTACMHEKRNFSDMVTSLDAHVLIGRNERELSESKRKILECSPNFPSTVWQGRWVPSESWDDFERLNFIGTPAQLTEKFMKYIELGCNYFMLWFLDLPNHDGMRLFAETVIPNVKDHAATK